MRVLRRRRRPAEVSRALIADVLRIDGDAMPVHAWPPSATADPLSTVDADVRDLTRRLAVAEAAMAEGAREGLKSSRRLLLSLIDVADAFERVFVNANRRESLSPETKAYTGNFRTVYRLLTRVLSDEGVAAMENLDDGFDPGWHAVADIVEDPSRADGTIVGEIQKGYLWRGQLLRRSQVVVVRNESRPAAPLDGG